MNRFSLPIRAFIILTILSSACVLWLGLSQGFDNPSWLLLSALIVSGSLAGTYRLPTAYNHLLIDLTGAILLIAVMLMSLPLACVVATAISTVSGIARKQRLWTILFNAGTEILAIALAAFLYHQVASPGMLPLDEPKGLLALLLCAGSYWATNSALVNVLISARRKESFLQCYVDNWREFYLQCILLTLIAVLGAAAWRQGPAYALLLFVPTTAMYQILSLSRFKQEQVIHAIEIIAEMLDRRNPFTFRHSHRVADYVVNLARRLGLSAGDTEVLHRAALIHDIGKLGVNDASDQLLPTGIEMTDYQFYSLKQHAQLGAMIAREIPAFEDAEEPIRYHHDWYNGIHVSKRHAGDEIPLGARIIAVADTYDQLCMTNGEASLARDPQAVEDLKAMRGRQLDPLLVDAFLETIAPQPQFAPAEARGTVVVTN